MPETAILWDCYVRRVQQAQRTSLLIPTGVLSAGQAYVFKVYAWQVPGINFAKTPFMIGPTTAFADVISGADSTLKVAVRLGRRHSQRTRTGAFQRK
jgi:hypothetical protein